MTDAAPQTPIYKAGLTKWDMPRDRAAGARAPRLPEDPGIVHAVRPVRSELGIREPYFIEDTYDYRAALCGAKVKIIMPSSFKADEDEACPDCIKALRKPQKMLISPTGKINYIFGDRWSPARWRRLRKRG